MVIEKMKRGPQSQDEEIMLQYSPSVRSLFHVGITLDYEHLVLLTWPVADLEIQKGGFSHWRAKRARKFLGCHAHIRSRWKSKLNISKQL